MSGEGVVGSGPDEAVIALSTAPAEGEAAHDLARQLVEEGLCACVNVLDGVVSHYVWQGALERSSERLLVIKTTRAMVERLRQRLVERHPYEVPEFLVVPVLAGHAPYLDWVAAAVRRAEGGGKRHGGSRPN